MKLKDRLLIYELFEGLEIVDIIGDKDIELKDLRGTTWTIVDNAAVYEGEGGIAFAIIESRVIKNEFTWHLLMLANWNNVQFVTVFDSKDYVPDMTYLPSGGNNV